jgi:hypothetical protein
MPVPRLLEAVAYLALSLAAEEDGIAAVVLVALPPLGYWPTLWETTGETWGHGFNVF